MKSPILLAPVLAGLALTLSAREAPDFHAWAPAPPMGWNSWDNFATAVTEAQTKAQADYMAANLRAHGWSYVVVDIQWYEAGARDRAYRQNAVLTMDAYGRLLPAPNRFPSAADGDGFKPLADYVHSLGLKFGIHLMRGIPRQAVEKNLPIFGTPHRAGEIANRASVCPWNPDMFGVDLAKPGAQEYYDSVFALIASWGVDFVKVDDIARPYFPQQPEIEAIRRAIDRTGRAIVLSLSPGETPLAAAKHVRRHANLWRISDDFWDRWLALRAQFARLAKWNPYRTAGAWPDADMLPLGVLELGSRTTRFTPDEQRTMMTLWSIARSPLMHGGDLTKTDPSTLALLTNDEVIAVNQSSAKNRPLFDRDGLIAWVADVPGSRDKYLAVFNARDRVPLTPGQALYCSAPVTREPSSAAAIDVAIAGATRLYLQAEAPDGVEGHRALWIEPTLVLAAGGTRRLTDLKWVQADALWDSASITPGPGAGPRMHAGRPIAFGLSALLPARIEYDLPPGVTRFTATGVIDGDEPAAPGAIRFIVNVATAGTETQPTALPVPVALADLGFSGRVRIRDLWSHADLGEASGSFIPEIPFHGAGLYRISAVAR